MDDFLQTLDLDGVDGLAGVKILAGDRHPVGFVDVVIPDVHGFVGERGSET